MANVERLTKRVKVMEEWIAENEEMGGPRGLLETMSFLVQETRRIGSMAENLNMNFNNLKQLNGEFLTTRELGYEWNEFISEKESAMQETEEQPKDKPKMKKAKKTTKKTKKEAT